MDIKGYHTNQLILNHWFHIFKFKWATNQSSFLVIKSPVVAEVHIKPTLSQVGLKLGQEKITRQSAKIIDIKKGFIWQDFPHPFAFKLIDKFALLGDY